MSALKSFLITGMLAIAAVAAPAEPAAADINMKIDPMSVSVVETRDLEPLERRKNTNKCEAHIHVDSSNGLCGAHCTDKWKVDIIDASTPPKAIGKTFDWSQVGTWAATNPNYDINIPTTKGPQFWIRGRLPSGIIKDNWRASLTLHYDSQHWNGMQCENSKYKSPRASNGFRHEFDAWCEFDC